MRREMCIFIGGPWHLTEKVMDLEEEIRCVVPRTYPLFLAGEDALRESLNLVADVGVYKLHPWRTIHGSEVYIYFYEDTVKAIRRREEILKSLEHDQALHQWLRFNSWEERQKRMRS